MHGNRRTEHHRRPPEPAPAGALASGLSVRPCQATARAPGSGLLLVLAASLLAVVAGAQEPQADKPQNPVSLVSRGEQLIKKGDPEGGALVLWQALDLLAGLPGNPVRDATTLSARYLLAESDPTENERRRVFAVIGKAQVELAQSYRGKKWFDTAAQRLDIAQRYDPDAVNKERGLLASARPKARPEAAALPPKVATEKPKLAELLRRANTALVDGDWIEVGGTLQCPPCDGTSDYPWAWVTKAPHADNEVIVECHPLAADQPHNATLAIGYGLVAATNSFSGYRAAFQCMPDKKLCSIRMWRVEGMQIKLLGEGDVGLESPVDGFHRLSVQVRGNRLRAQFDEQPAIEVDAGQPVRGQVGLYVGISQQKACAMQFRNFRIDPLPSDVPTDDQLREQAEAENQNAITTGVEQARELLAKKQPEAASLLLRETLRRLEDLPAGILRDNLQKPIEQMLIQADPLAGRRKKTAQMIAGELVGLANAYAATGRVRLAFQLAREAVRYDPVGQASRLVEAEAAVDKWNLAQATARAAELAPPEDDGTVLREWFATGSRIDSRFHEWVVEGPAARLDDLPVAGWSALMPKPGMPPLTKASVAVQLPQSATYAGFSFNVAGPHDYALGVLERQKLGLVLIVYRYVNGRWSELGRRPVDMDAWRLDGWFVVGLEATPKGFLLRAAGAELAVDQSRLGPATGRLGLAAGNASKVPVTMSLRAFRLGS
jgi:tetratricopeptide (TPR) repeat protein